METIERISGNIHLLTELQSIVRTMKAMAAVNIRQYERAVESLLDYQRNVEQGFQILLRKSPDLHELNSDKDDAGLGAIIFGTDQGMCGPINEQIVEFALENLRKSEPSAERRKIVAVGFKLGAELEHAGEKVDQVFSVPNSTSGITPVGHELLILILDWHARGNLNRFVIYFTQHGEDGAHEPRVIQLLPIDFKKLETLRERKWPTRMLPTFTMDWRDLLAALIRQHLFISIFRACAESLASENASRLVAMQSAEKNVEERLAQLQTQYHQERQSIISSELLDIISGYEATSLPPRAK